MKTIDNLLVGVEVVQIKGNTAVEIKKICFDTREVEALSLFVAQKGTKVDGHQFVSQAIEKGAVAVVVEKMPKQLLDTVCYIQVKRSSFALALMAANFYDNPSQKLQLIGITGTNGKTTTVTLLYRLMMAMHKKTGLLSTIENRINDKIYPATHTTADSVALNRMLAEMVAAGCQYCFMEVSSHAIVQDRIVGLHFKGAIFSNLTHDHLDYHKTFSAYRDAKKMFFDQLPTTAFALTNIDDANGDFMLQNTKAKQYRYSLQNARADFKAKIGECNFNGLNLKIDNKDVWFRLIGKFNAYNLLAIYGTAVLLGFDREEVLMQMSNLEAAEGRFFTLRGKGIIVIVDYAHTPDALKNVLETINNIVSKEEEIVTVVGCGGDRDKTKRPEMAEIACLLSHRVILTSDNPRSENPHDIIEDMLKGVSKAYERNLLVIEDRKQAIKAAIMQASPNTVILIAGKGHEKYQDIAGVKHHFDDVEVAEEYLKDK